MSRNVMLEIFGGSDASNVDEFQRTNSLLLSDSYRQFLIEFNGGRPGNAEFGVAGWGSTLVNYFYGLSTQDAYSLEHAWERVNDNAGNEVLPIGADPGGWEVFLAVRGPDAGAVYFYDHTNEESTPIRIADSFEAFFNGLHPEGAFDDNGNFIAPDV